MKICNANKSTIVIFIKSYFDNVYKQIYSIP